MDHPCETCVVSACCSRRCREYARYIYKSKEYAQAGNVVETQILGMEYTEAINHILNVENIVLMLKLMDDKKNLERA